MIKHRKSGLVTALLMLTGCAGQPEGVDVVSAFDAQRYLGTWYEVARFDHSFERGMDNVTATYSQREDGGLKVVNKGRKNGKWKSATGKAYFTGSPDVGQLKVSFFGPFYGGYNIIELDKAGYQYSLVAGNDRDMLWILARDPQLAKETVQQLVDKAASLGFATDKLIYVAHDAVEQ